MLTAIAWKLVDILRIKILRAHLYIVLRNEKLNKSLIKNCLNHWRRESFKNRWRYCAIEISFSDTFCPKAVESASLQTYIGNAHLYSGHTGITQQCRLRFFRTRDVALYAVYRAITGVIQTRCDFPQKINPPLFPRRAGNTRREADKSEKAMVDRADGDANDGDAREKEKETRACTRSVSAQRNWSYFPLSRTFPLFSAVLDTHASQCYFRTGCIVDKTE